MFPNNSFVKQIAVVRRVEEVNKMLFLVWLPLQLSHPTMTMTYDSSYTTVNLRAAFMNKFLSIQLPSLTDKLPWQVQ